MFLRNFSKVPDDRLGWSPSGTSKTPLRIAAHTALYAARFAAMIRDRKLPAPENLDAWIAERDAEEMAITDRNAIEPIYREGTHRVLQALDSLTDDDLDLVLDSSQGWTASMRWVIDLPTIHANLHCGQIDFIQTCWNDQEIYVG